jgi:hypothetical protein
MSTTLSDVLTSLAYRLGENSSPTDTNEKARRVRFIVQGYKDALNRHPFWFTEESTTFNSVANQSAYTTVGGFPTDYRDMIELRVDDVIYTAIPQSKVFGAYDSSINRFNYDELLHDRHYYVFDGTLYLLPETPSNGTNNISMKYYKWPTMPTVDASTFVIPDAFIECLSAYAYARISQIDDRRGDASDGFDEYNEILGRMIAENNRQKFYGKSIRPVHPNYLVD